MTPVRAWGAAVWGLLPALLGPTQPLAEGSPGLTPASGPAALHFAGREGQSFQIVVQRVDARTGRPMRGAGPLYLTNDYPHIDYPTAPALDAASQTTLRLFVHPPPPGSPCRGRIIVWVILDEEDADDTRGARVVIPYTADPQATGCMPGAETNATNVNAARGQVSGFCSA